MDKETYAYFKKGQQLQSKGQIEEAIAAYQTAIELNPNFSWSYFNLGKLMAQINRLDEAVIAYSRAIELQPSSAWYYYDLGEILFKLNRLDEALNFLQKALEINPNVSEFYKSLGKILLSLNRVDEAIDYFNKSLNIDQNYSWSYYYLGNAQAKKGEIDSAINSYNKAIEKRPLFPEAYKSLGEISVKIGQIEEAISYYQKACQFNPHSIEYYHHLAQVLELQTQKQLENLASNPNLGEIILQENLSLNPSFQVEEINDRAFLEITKNIDERAFVQELYCTYLRREAEPTSKEGYSNLIISGQITRKKLLEEFRKTPEFKNRLERSKKLEEEIACYLESIKIRYELLEDEIACYKKSLEINPLSYESCYKLAAVYKRNRLSSQVDGATQKALEIGLIFAREGNFNKALDCYQKALGFLPEKITAFSDLAIFLVRQGLVSELVKCYQKSVTNLYKNTDIYHNLGKLFAQQGFIDEAAICFEEISQISEPSELDIYGKIWQELNQINLIDEESSDHQEKFTPKVVEDYFKSVSNYKSITLQSLTNLDRKYLEKVGLSLETIQLIAQNDRLLENIYTNRYKNDSQNQINQPLRLTLPYQQSIIETGYIYSLCPFSGRILRSNKSFVINHFEVGHHDLQGFLYHFVGKEIFYLMVGCPMGEKLLLYIPKLELIINFDQNLIGFVNPESSINKLKSYMVSYGKQVKSYLKTEKKKAVNLVGLGFNIGHHVWQDLAGINILSKNNLLPQVDILLGPGDYFSMRDIFSEIPSEKIVAVKDIWDTFKTIVSNNYVAFRANGTLIHEELANKICDVSFNKCSPDFLQQVESAKNKYFPLIGIQIRVSSRVWLEQAKGIANIITQLYSNFPNLGIVFDGWSLMENEDDTAHRSIIKKERGVMKNILESIPEKVPTYSSIGSTTYDTVVWAKTVDFHITPLGAGILYSSWIANKPGIVHGHTFILDTYGNQVTMSTVRENNLPQVALPKQYVTDVSPSCDYNCDWQGIYNEVVKIINSLNRSN